METLKYTIIKSDKLYPILSRSKEMGSVANLLRFAPLVPR